MIALIRLSLRFLTSALAAITFGTGAIPAAALDNLFPDPGFDVGLGGFAKGIGPHTVEWKPTAGIGGTGGLKITGIQANGSGNVVSPCVDVTAIDSLVFGAIARSDAAAISGTVIPRLRFFSDDICNSILDPDAIGNTRTRIGYETWGPLQGRAEVPTGARSALLMISLSTGSVAPSTIVLDDAFLFADASCVTTTSTLCFADDRFLVTAEWEDPHGKRGYAGAFPMTADSGGMWFFHPSNVELVVKVLAACGLNDRFWVFAAGLTNVEVSLNVEDTLTGEVWLYENPQGIPFPPVQDTDAFATCNGG